MNGWECNFRGNEGTPRRINHQQFDVNCNHHGNDDEKSAGDGICRFLSMTVRRGPYLLHLNERFNRWRCDLTETNYRCIWLQLLSVINLSPQAEIEPTFVSSVLRIFSCLAATYTASLYERSYCHTLVGVCVKMCVYVHVHVHV